MKKIISSVILIALSIIAPFKAQVGINTSSPSSTLEINGSLEGAYRKVTSSTTINDKDYYVAYEGTTAANITLPSASPVSGNTSFTGRTYRIKNLSTSTITIQAASGQNLKFGGGLSNSNSFILNGGNFVVITANDTGNTWNLDFAGSSASDSSWKLYSTTLSSIINSPQVISPVNAQVSVNGTTLTVTVPSGYSQAQIALRWDVWGHGNSDRPAFGSLRFHILQTGTSSRTISSIMMSSWATTTEGNDMYSRFAAPASFAVSDLGPGTYTFNLSVERNDEKTSPSGSFNNPPAGTIKNVTLWGVQGKAEVYVK
ncbi:hypothetical protein [Chryseobacterium contaminans]|uniref:hypothetical protein n=1 Tax=Chryseobacterium contaminans TaxID=1423959 RepID=UPI003019BC3B